MCRGPATFGATFGLFLQEGRTSEAVGSVKPVAVVRAMKTIENPRVWRTIPCWPYVDTGTGAESRILRDECRARPAEGGVTSDRDGEERPWGMGWDMGCDEMVDMDGDGLPDAWERSVFGNLGSGPEGDPGGSGSEKPLT